MRELLLDIDVAQGRRAGLEQAIRAAIRHGQLLPGMLVPSTRSLAADYGLARATVVAAYEQLMTEGYLVAKQGVGTRVADVSLLSDRPINIKNPTTHRPSADFSPGEPDPSLFPRSAWSRSVHRVLTEVSDSELGYGDPRGAAPLRSELVEYLGRSRAISSNPEDLSVFGGVTSAFGFLGEAFLANGIKRIAFEDPALSFLRDVFTLVGMTVVPVPVDDEGISVEQLAERDVGAVVVTPGHQFPLGVTMSPRRRSDLVEWARNTGSWIVEDDYDGEFRYGGRPVGALQGLDPERIIYAGTTSKMLIPGLRISWLAVPSSLRAELARVKSMRGSVSIVEQLALADFIGRGELDRHLRLARGAYLKRQKMVHEVLERHTSWLRCSSSLAGLHLAATLTTTEISESDLVQGAAKRDVGLFPLSPLWLGPPTQQGLVIGYSRPAAYEFSGAIEALAGYLDAATP